jgi:hypothetical protein
MGIEPIISHQQPSRLEQFSIYAYRLMQKLNMFGTSTELTEADVKKYAKEHFPPGTPVWRNNGKEHGVSLTGRIGMSGIVTNNIYLADNIWTIEVESIQLAQERHHTDYGSGYWPLYQICKMEQAEEGKYRGKK